MKIYFIIGSILILFFFLINSNNTVDNTLCSVYYNGNKECVESGEIKISKNKLFTSFIYSCSVLSFKFEKENNIYYFMAHVDTMNNNMENDLEKYFDNIKNLIKNIKTFYIYYGSLCTNDNCKSKNIIKRLLEKNNISSNKIKKINLKNWNKDTVHSED